MYQATGELNKKRQKVKATGEAKVAKITKGTKGTKGAGRGLPIELVEKILCLCDRKDLLRCCVVSKALYQLALPLVYCTYDPTIWPDLVRLERQLHRGIGPACFDGKELALSVAAHIQIIDLNFPKGSANYREAQWTQQESIRSLSRIISKTQRLRSFTWQNEPFHEDMTPLWKALARSSVQELVLSDRWPQPNASMYGPKSKLWNLQHLSKIHLTLLWSPSQSQCQGYFTSGLTSLLRETPSLTDLKLSLVGIPEMGLPVGEMIGDSLFQINTLSNLCQLDFENVAFNDDAKLFQFLSSLGKLEKLRWVREHLHGDHDLFHSPGRHHPDLISSAAAKVSLILPSLKQVDVTELALLRATLFHNSPTTATNVHLSCSLDIPQSRQPADLSFLQHCSSIQELHLFIHGLTHTVECRDKTVSCLNSIPNSVVKLAIQMPSHLSQIKLTHPTTSKDYLEALRRLNQLEYLILPWTAVVYKTESQTSLEMDELKHIIDNRVKSIARKIAEKIPTLKYVFFQGSHEINSIGDSAWQPNFDEKDIVDRRFCVKITREIPREDKAWIKKGFLKSTSQNATPSKAKKDGNGSGHGVENEKKGQITKEDKSSEIGIKVSDVVPTIKVEMIIGTCVCPNCWLDEKGSRKDTEDEDESMDFMFESMMPMLPMGMFPIEM